ncbi:hypothetical protein Taro_010257 [Colocasia esculenta]|uniref:Uncharacterized protein n=1 Tax=Colocasia esculenta TaxID=4460 RepID=A0A843U2T9_COLES|nr:hypothetical protein [Colocasia esculenta]
MKKWSSGVDTRSSSVDTRPSSQRTVSTGLDSVSTLDQMCVDTLRKLFDLKSHLDTWHSRDLVDRPWIMCPRCPRVLLDTLGYKYSPNWPSNHERASKSLPEIFSAAERALLPVLAPLVLLQPNSHISKHKK